jgi:hypothetical protein
MNINQPVLWTDSIQTYYFLLLGESLPAGDFVIRTFAGATRRNRSSALLRAVLSLRLTPRPPLLKSKDDFRRGAGGEARAISSFPAVNPCPPGISLSARSAAQRAEVGLPHCCAPCYHYRGSGWRGGE